MPIESEWPRISSRIFDGAFPLQMSHIRPPILFGHVELCGVRMAGEIEPEQFVEPHGVDHQGVAVPMPDRFAVPGGIGIFGMLPAVHEYLPVAVNVAFK